MKIAFVHQPTQRIIPGAPRGSAPVWTAAVSKRIRGEHQLFAYSREFPDLVGQETQDGCTYIRVPAPADIRLARYVLPLTRLLHPRRSSFSSPLFYPQYYRRVARDMASRGVDIVHVHSFPQAASIIRAEHPRAKIVVHLHIEWLNLLPPRVARQQIRDADLILGCSEYLSTRMRSALPEFASRIRTVHNPVDVGHFTPDSSERRSREAPTVLFVGRLSPEKGLHVLLEAFRTVARENPDLRLDIVGSEGVAPFHLFASLGDSGVVASIRPFYDTTPWARLRTRLRGEYPRRLRWLEDTSYFGRLQRMAIKNRVRFLGHVANEKLPEHYRRAAVCVMPSISETFGIPLVEAMACGTPTIATKAGGMPEIVQHQRTGLLVEVGDAAGLADAIRRLISDAALQQRMSDAARARAVDHFSIEKIVERLLAEYAELCPDKADAGRRAQHTTGLGAA